jgi:drug/metabolite transporter (DMT)-like permease
LKNVAVLSSTTSNCITGRSSDNRRGIVLIFSSAVVWSSGGVLKRFITTSDDWTIIFWRSLWAALFLLGFMLFRDGRRGTVQLFAKMGLPGIGVAICFAIASTCFVIALAYTTVANILMMQAGTPLIAALIIWFLFREKVTVPTWIAISFVIFGVVVMVSDSFSGHVSPLGDSLSLMIVFAFAFAIVITNRYTHVRMIPATCLGTFLATCVSGSLAGTFDVTLVDMVILMAFGILNLGLGLALFVTGAPLISSTLVALIGTAEPILGPIWMWLIHDEVPSFRTIVGGLIVLGALFSHLSWRIYRQKSAIVSKTQVNHSA